MKEFKEPVVEIEKFELVDVISTSSGSGDPDELPEDRD